MASLPASAASGLSQRERAATTDRCVPAEEMAAGFVHPKCRASALIGSYAGVCISDCVKKNFLTGLSTSRGDCAPDTFCAPCKNPLTGAPTGAPDCGPWAARRDIQTSSLRPRLSARASARSGSSGAPTRRRLQPC